MSGASAPVHWLPFLMGFTAGMLSRLLSLQPGRREYPGWPSGYISQLALGIIAAMIGGGLLTSLFAKQFTAATFLTLAATQFRDVRQTERTTLLSEESLILVSRGAGYIEGIAMTYEARNFLAMLVALATSAVAFWLGVWPGIVGGVVFIILGQIFMRGRTIGLVLDVKPGTIHFEQESLLYVDEVMLMDVGLKEVREAWLKDGIAVTLVPKSPQGQAVLWNVGQRQAITHEAAMSVGVRKDIGYPDYTPLTRMDMPAGSGVAALAIIPAYKDMERLIRAVKTTPMLESSKMARVLSPTLLKSDGHSSRKGSAHHG